MEKKFANIFKLLWFAKITYKNPKMWKGKSIKLHNDPLSTKKHSACVYVKA